MMILTKLALLFGVIAASSPVDSLHSYSKRAVLPPSQDPFWTPPRGYASKKPGTVLRHRAIANASTVYGSPSIKAAYQILYRTTDSVGNAEATVETLFIPAANADPTKYVSYQIPYDSAYINCGPSYTLRTGGNTSVSDTDLQLMVSLLAQGYYVSTPDYEGPSGAFTAGVGSGQATLDGVRAVLKSSSFSGIAASGVSYALWGYSGGALASEWALELQHAYAPELSFVGAALGGLTPNISSVLLAINNGPFAGLAPAGIIGLTRAYANLSTFVNNHLNKTTKAQFLQAGAQCLDADTTEFAFKNVESYFTPQSLNILDAPIPKSIINIAGIMGRRGVPKPPLYVYKAIADEISPVVDTDNLVNEYCAKGAQIIYNRDVAGEHLTEEILGAPGAVAFLKTRLSGLPAEDGCTIATVDLGDALVDTEEGILTQSVYEALQAILAQEESSSPPRVK